MPLPVVLVVLLVVVAGAVTLGIWRARRRPGLVPLIRRDDAAGLRRRLDDLPPEAVHTPTAEGLPLLHVAAEEGAEACVAVLLERGAVVDEIDPDGTTALQQASALGHVGIARVLLDAGADVDLVDDLGVSALHYAASAGREEIVHLLLGHGAEPGLKDMAGRSPLDVATGAICAVLEAAGGKPGPAYRMADVLARWPEHKRLAYRFPRAFGMRPDDPRLVAARARAQESRDRLDAAIAAGRPARVKLRIEADAVWAEVVGRGVADDLLVEVTTLPAEGPAPAGPRALPLDEVLDWQIEDHDGRLRGAYTNRVTFEAMREEYGFLPPDLAEQLAELHEEV